MKARFGETDLLRFRDHECPQRVVHVDSLAVTATGVTPATDDAGESAGTGG